MHIKAVVDASKGGSFVSCSAWGGQVTVGETRVGGRRKLWVSDMDGMENTDGEQGMIGVADMDGGGGGRYGWGWGV